jgi:hypothetical protein
MEDVTVDAGAYSRYCNKIMHFLAWAGQIQQFTCATRRQESRTPQKAYKGGMDGEATKCKTDSNSPCWAHNTCPRHAGLHLTTSEPKNLDILSPAGYSAKRMGVFHFIWCHNGKGPSQDFQDKRTALWKGFSRTANKRKMRARQQACINAQGNGDDDDDDDDDDDNSDSSRSDVDNEEDNNDRNKFKEGKEPMSPELYQSICKWLVEWGNSYGMFAA